MLVLNALKQVKFLPVDVAKETPGKTDLYTQFPSVSNSTMDEMVAIAHTPQSASPGQQQNMPGCFSWITVLVFMASS